MVPEHDTLSSEGWQIAQKVENSVTCDAFCDVFCDGAKPHKYRGFEGGVTEVTEKTYIYTRAREK